LVRANLPTVVWVGPARQVALFFRSPPAAAPVAVCVGPPYHPATTSNMNPDDVENDHFLEDALKSVKKHAWHMKRAMDLDNLKDVLQHAADMLYELRTSRLTPRNYYRLYMDIADELMHLEHFFSDMHRKGTPMEDLYRMVQHAGNVLPRLYLLVTAGSVYIQSKEAPAKDILKDVVEMCKGVQHPMRGLFLRNYISHITKNKLPDVDNEFEGEGGSVQHSVDFVLQNFSEMNKLWVRMQYQRTHAKSKREKQRRELKVLVGTNLRRLSDLEGINVDYYKSTVLPRILEQVISCKDAIAQDYLMEIIIQVFPSEFHLATLEPFLQACKVCEHAITNTHVIRNAESGTRKQAQPRVVRGWPSEEYCVSVGGRRWSWVSELLPSGHAFCCCWCVGSAGNSHHRASCIMPPCPPFLAVSPSNGRARTRGEISRAAGAEGFRECEGHRVQPHGSAVHVPVLRWHKRAERDH
jgi:hypothetical protein